jgi:hypothetical protein
MWFFCGWNDIYRVESFSFVVCIMDQVVDDVFLVIKTKSAQCIDRLVVMFLCICSHSIALYIALYFAEQWWLALLYPLLLFGAIYIYTIGQTIWEKICGIYMTYLDIDSSYKNVHHNMSESFGATRYGWGRLSLYFSLRSSWRVSTWICYQVEKMTTPSTYSSTKIIYTILWRVFIARTVPSLIIWSLLYIYDPIWCIMWVVWWRYIYFFLLLVYIDLFWRYELIRDFLNYCGYVKPLDAVNPTIAII